MNRKLKRKLIGVGIGLGVLGALALALYLFLPWGITTTMEPQWVPEGGGLSHGAVLSTDDAFRQVLRRGDLTLYANLANASFYIEDARSGKTWYSNPPDIDRDFAIGFDLQQVRSKMIIDVNMIMTEGGAPVSTRFADFASGNYITHRILDDALVFVFHFDRAELSIPIMISLFDHGFAVELLNAEVRENGRHILTQVLLLPSFGAAGPDDEGYMLIPDGSGALIHLNNYNPSANRLGVNMYGFNAGSGEFGPSSIGNITFPLWGKRVNDDGYLAIVTGGASRAGIMAQSGGMGSIFNLVYGNYVYRETAGVRLVTQGFNEEILNITQTFPDFNNNFRVEYHFLPTGSASYVDMAAHYRRHLGLEPTVSGGDIPFYLDIFGHVVKTRPFLGFPRDTVIPTATFAQAESLVRELQSAGVNNIALRYSYWQRGGYYDDIVTNPRPMRALGGRNDLASLRNAVEAAGGELFLMHEPLHVYEGGNGFIPIFDALKTISRTAQRQFATSLVGNAVRDINITPWYLVRPQRIAHFFDNFWGHFNGANYGHLALDSIGEMLYSELATDGMNRCDVQREIEALLAIPDRLMLNGAYDYAAVHANHIINSPTRSSGFDIYDAEVPFWQIVFHGYRDYSLKAFNLSSNPSHMRLHALETGARPMFSWVLQNAHELIGSRSDWLFSAEYTDWLQWAIDEYHAINAILSQVANRPITAHARHGHISMTEYGGWMTVLCNYGGEAADFMGQRVPAGGVVVIYER